MIFLYILLTE